MKRFCQSLPQAVLILCRLVGCHKKNKDAVVPGSTLTQGDTSTVQRTDVTLSQQGKLFWCFPGIEVDTVPYSVAVVNLATGKARRLNGMIVDAAGNLYSSAMQQNAVIRNTPDGMQTRMVQDVRLKWPDTFAPRCWPSPNARDRNG